MEMAKIMRVFDRTFRDYIVEYRMPNIENRRHKRFELEKVLRHLETQGQRIEPPANQKSKITVEVKKPNNKYRKVLRLE